MKYITSLQYCFKKRGKDILCHNPVGTLSYRNLERSQTSKILVNYFLKKLHFRCFTGFCMRLFIENQLRKNSVELYFKDNSTCLKIISYKNNF